MEPFKVFLAKKARLLYSVTAHVTYTYLFTVSLHRVLPGDFAMLFFGHTLEKTLAHYMLPPLVLYFYFCNKRVKS